MVPGLELTGTWMIILESVQGGSLCWTPSQGLCLSASAYLPVGFDIRIELGGINLWQQHELASQSKSGYVKWWTDFWDLVCNTIYGLYISCHIYLLLISNFHMFRRQAGPPSDHLALHTAYAGKPCSHGGHAVGEWCLEDVVLVKVKWDDARRNRVGIWNFNKMSFIL